MLTRSTRVSRTLAVRSWVLSTPLAFASLTGCAVDFGQLDEPSFGGAPDEPTSGETGSGGDVDPGEGGKPTASAGAGGVGSTANAPSSSAGTPDKDDGGSPSDDGGAGDIAPVPSCVARGPETCNAQDDDCNGLIDDACAGSLTTTFDKDFPLIGDSAGGRCAGLSPSAFP